MGITGCSTCAGCVGDCSIVDLDYRTTDHAVGEDISADWTEMVGDWEVYAAPSIATYNGFGTANSFSHVLSTHEPPTSGDWTVIAQWLFPDYGDIARLIFGYLDEDNYQFFEFQQSDGTEGGGPTTVAHIRYGQVSVGVLSILSERVELGFPPIYRMAIKVCYDSDLDRIRAEWGFGNYVPTEEGDGINLAHIEYVIPNPIMPGNGVGIGTQHHAADYFLIERFQILKGSDGCPTCNAACPACNLDGPNFDWVMLTLTGVIPNPNYDCATCTDDCLDPCTDCDDCESPCDDGVTGCPGFNDSFVLPYIGTSAFGSVDTLLYGHFPCVWGKRLETPFCGYNYLYVIFGVFFGSGHGATPVWRAFVSRVSESAWGISESVGGFETGELIFGDGVDCCGTATIELTPVVSAIESSGKPCRMNAESTATITLPYPPDCTPPTTTTTEPPPPGEWYCDCQPPEYDCGPCVNGAENVTGPGCGGPYDTEADCLENAACVPCGTTTTTEPPTTTTTAAPQFYCCNTGPDEVACVELAHDEECDVVSGPYVDEIECLIECSPPTTTTTCECTDSVSQQPGGGRVCVLQPVLGVWQHVVSCTADNEGHACPCWACYEGDWVKQGMATSAPPMFLNGTCGYCNEPDEPCS